MNFQAIAKKGSVLFKRAGFFLQQNSPTIFAGVAIAGVVGTTVMTVRATTKAHAIIEEAKCVNPDNPDEIIEPDLKETIVLTWKCYIPVVLAGGITIGAIVAGHSIQARRNAILAGLLTTSQQALEDYQKKAEEIVGHSKAEKIKEGVIEDKLMKHPIDKSTVIETGHGRSLCFDPWSGRYFWSDYDQIHRTVSDFNLRLVHEYRLCLNEFYEMLNLDSTECGEEVGFTTDIPLNINPKSKLASDGTPCLVIDYSPKPSPTFRDW